MFQLPNYMHMGCKKCRHCLNVWVEDACKVLGRDFNLKSAVGVTKGVMDNGVTNYKMPHLSSVVPCLVIYKPN